MKIALTVFFGLFSSVALADYAQTLQLWQEGDWKVQKIQDQEYLGYSDEQLAELLPVLTKWIPIQEELEQHPDDSWKEFVSGHDWTPFLNALPPDHPIKKKWGLGREALWIIRILSEKRRITDESLLPVLITGVGQPSLFSTGRDSFYSLTALTKLYDGPLTSWGNLEFPRDAVAISEWFQAWHQKNQGKELIVTAKREKEIKKEYLFLCADLEDLVSDRSHGLHGFKAPTDKDYHRVGEPLFGIKWDGRFRSSIPGDTHGDGWVWVLVRPQTKLIEGIKGWERYPSWDALEALPDGAQLVHSRTVSNSDWALEIYVNRLSEKEIESLSEGLKLKAEQGSGGNG